MSKTKLFIVDDNFVARRGLRGVLETEKDFDVIGEASSGAELLDSPVLRDADIVLMDIRMAGMDGIQATIEVKKRYPSVRVLAMTSVDDPIILANIINAGAQGYLVYGQFSPAGMVDAIRQITAGKNVLIPPLEEFFGQEVQDTIKEIATYYHDPLTDREKNVLSLIGSGCSNATIAEVMEINEKTVKNYVTRIYSKLGITNRREAILYVLNTMLEEDAI